MEIVAKSIEDSISIGHELRSTIEKKRRAEPHGGYGHTSAGASLGQDVFRVPARKARNKLPSVVDELPAMRSRPGSISDRSASAATTRHGVLQQPSSSAASPAQEMRVAVRKRLEALRDLTRARLYLLEEERNLLPTK